MRKLTTEDFILRSKALFGDRFTYDYTTYKTRRDSVVLTCKVHGNFEQSVSSHFMGRGCDRCGPTHKPTTEEWVAKTIDLRGNFYDYSEVIYESNKKKVSILCPEHGRFYQAPDNHRSLQDCPNCASSGFKVNLPAVLYVLGCSENITKIGVTNRKTSTRVRQVSVASGMDFKILLELHLTNGRTALNIETVLKQHLKTQYSNIDKHFDGYTETFVDVDRQNLYLKIAETHAEITPQIQN